MQTNVLRKSLFLCFALIFVFGNIQAATPPLVPFNTTGDLYVMDDSDAGSGNILRITPDGSVSVAVTRAQIIAVSGLTDPDFSNCGIAFDADNNMYFSVYDSAAGEESIIMKSTPQGALSVLTTAAAIRAATGGGESDVEGIAFGSDGMLYACEAGSDGILRINPSTGAVSVFATEAGIIADTGVSGVSLGSSIVGAEGSILYAASDSGDNAIFEFDSAGNASILAAGDPPFSDLDVFMTREASGDIIIADNAGADTIFRVTPAGSVSTFLSEADLEGASCVNADVDLEGGIAFDSDGFFYIAEETSGNIYRFAPGTLACSLFVSESDIIAVTGASGVDFEGGMAFAGSGSAPRPIPTLSEWGMIIMSLILAGSAIWIIRRRQVS